MATALITGGLGLLGGFLGNRPQKTTQNSFQDNHSTTSNSTTPQYDPLNLSLRDTLLDKYRNSLDEDPNLEGYKAQGVAQIQQAGNARKQALQNALTSRGLSYSNVSATAPSSIQGQTTGDIASFSNSIPLLIRQLQDQRLAAAASFQRGIPLGTTSNGEQIGRTSGQSEITQPGNALGGGISSLATILGGLAGNNGGIIPGLHS